MRSDGRRADEIRPVVMTPGFIRSTDGSVLIEMGETRVICTATIEDKVPQFLRDSGRGWVTAEYGMLPGSGDTRIEREVTRGRIGGRTHEIQRLIGRSLRAVTDMTKLGERTVWIDCDVIQADGGTRTASITGAYVALALAVRKLAAQGKSGNGALREAVAAISVGVVGSEVLVDLRYDEDSRAAVDMNFVMTQGGQYVEVQGTAEHNPFSKVQLDHMAELAWAAITQLTRAQADLLAKM
ncbi:MAG: ribonuclease PH [Deltaproteobacteria bacterium]|nr:ribonuclease PH [Deltaproteobacteria bacterium]MBI3389482.1 ribonuclease PH [Deltaproteobacteria bacterium]